jgi:hypothetical protein
MYQSYENFLRDPGCINSGLGVAVGCTEVADILTWCTRSINSGSGGVVRCTEVTDIWEYCTKCVNGCSG